jgi:hypothetical protein
MRSFLEQASASRQTATGIRKHASDPETSDFLVAFKLAERLEARAADLEYRWLTMGSTPKRREKAPSFLIRFQSRGRTAQ